MIVAAIDWKKASDNLPVGALVIIVDETIKRKTWKMGQVVAVEGSDEHTRRIKVRNHKGEILTRDRTGVVRLELDE